MIKRIAILIIAELLILGQITPVMAANEVFNQTDWIGGADTVASGVHPTNKTGWNKYYSKNAFINTASAGKVTQTAEPLTTIDTTDADFQKTGSLRDKVNVSNGSLVLDGTSEDPFVDNLGQWTSLPEIPRLDWWSAYLRMVHPTDGKIYIYALFSGKTFGRFNTETNTWQILADTPKPFGLGASLAYPPGSGDFIYALRGAGTKEFWKYSLSGNTWTKIKDTNYLVGAGGSITAYSNSNSIYCVAGNATRKFMVYSISADTWTNLEPDISNANVDRQGSLVYPGTGEYIYLNNSQGSTAIARYRVTAPAGWSTVTSAPVSIADMCYPGTGNYLYAWSGDNWNRGFARLNFTQAGAPSSWTWENLTTTAMLPMYPYRAIMYYPGTGSKLKWLSAGNYSRVFNFDTSTSKWDEPSGVVVSDMHHGADMVYDGTYIYTTRGNNTNTFWRYNPSTDVWESRDIVPFGVYYGGSLTVLNGNVYATRGYNATNFAMFNGTLWADLTSTQPMPASISYGGQLCAAGSSIYAFRGRDSSGNDTNKFYRYDPASGWDDAAAADASATVGPGGSLVYPGVADDNGDYFIYATRGATTKTFWRYCISSTGGYTANTWYPIADAPFRVAYKGRLIYPGSGDYIYLFSGFNNQFARYKFKGTTDVNTWETLEPTPFEQSYYYGACAVGNKIYANYLYDRSLYIYDIATGQWSQRYLDTYPTTYQYGRIVYPGGDSVYMFYGNYTSHIWQYSISQKRWAGLIQAAYNGNPILFKPGAKACYPGSGNYIYMIEGGNTNRFWSYDYVNNTWAPLSGPQVSGVPLRFYSGSQLDGKGNVLYACQGRDVTNATEERSYKFLTYTISTAPAGTWQVSAPLTDLPDLPNYIKDTYELGSKFLHIPSANKLYWMGYEDTTLRIYDTVTKLWATASAPQFGIRARSGSCFYYHAPDNSIYLFLGQNYSKFVKYSIDSNSWTELTIHGRGTGYTGYDADAFYPAAGGDHLYFSDGAWNYFTRYSLSKNDWDLPATTPYYSYYPNFSEGADGNTLFFGTYIYFYKYTISTRSWTTLVSPYSTPALAWWWDEWGSQLVYFPGDMDSIFSTRGRNRSNFARYSISQNLWTACLSPGAFGNGHYLVASPYKIYALMGGSNTTFKSYNPSTPSNPWVDEPVFPATVSSGSAMVYIPAENAIYAARGNNTQNFYKFTISNPQWLALENTPVPLRGDPSGTSLVYPGVGDYIYLLSGPSYSNWGETRSFYRFSLSQQIWDTTEQQSAPVGIRGSARIVYPGKGNYLYALRGYNYPDIFKYSLFKQGMYTSEIKNIGRNKNYGIINWTDTGNGSFEFKARTSDNQAMSGATGWDSVPVRKKEELLSDSYPAIRNKHQYFQYRFKFLADDLTKLPTLNDLTINYEKYRTKQELISSPYDSTEANNRLMKLSWTEAQPTGTDIRMQIKTASTKAGLDDVNNYFLGPGGTQTFNDNYSNAADYAYAPTIEVVNGTAKLKKIYEDYLYTQRIVLDNSAGTTSYINNVFEITIASQNNDFWQYVKSDGSDIRFADANGNALSYNLHAQGASFDYTNKTAKIFVKVPSVPAGQKATIFLKYGKADALSASDTNVVGVPLDGLVGYWRFSEGAGETTADGSGQNNTGTLQNGASWTTGKSGGGILFNGGTSRVYILNSSSLQVSGNMTIAFWLKPTTVGSGRRNPIHKEYAREFSFTMEDGGANGTSYYHGWGGGYYGTGSGFSSSNIANDVWTHYAFVRDNTTRTWTSYKNGEVDRTGSWPSGQDPTAGTSPVLIGNGYAGGVGGVMDNVIIYNRVLTGTEIASLNSGGELLSIPIYFALVVDKATSPSLAGWEYRNEIEINNLSGGALTDYQLEVNLTKDHEDFWARCKSDGFDVRFIDSNNTAILSYYRSSFDYANKAASFWVKVPAISAAATKRIYLYYGKSDAADVSSFNNTFTKDFEERGYNTSAVGLNGTVDQKVTVNHASSLNATSAVTIEANVKYTADTWLPGFGYRKMVTLDNTAGPARTNALAKFDVAYVTSKMNADFSDIRFIDTDGTKLRYKINSYVASTSATVLVEIPSIPAASTKDIYLYYGNANTAGEEDTALKEMPPSGLIGYWKFDEGSGTSAADSSLSNYTGTFLNTPQWVEGKVGKALQTNNVDNGVSIPATNFAGLTDYTMAAWVNIKGNHRNYTGTIMSSGDWNNIYWVFGIKQDNTQIHMRANSTGPNYAFQLNRWYHIAVTRSGSTGTFYIDGTSIGTVSLGASALVSANTNTAIGRETYGSGNFSFNGVVDEPVIYNRALSDAEVQSVYAAIRPSYVLSASFGSEATQPAIDSTIISKSGAYELKMSTSGLTGLINGVARVSTANYGVGTFTHMAFVYDGAKARIVVNGIEKASADLTGAITTNSNPVLIGESLKGAIDEVRIWNVARKVGDLLENKEKCLVGTETGLRCYLRFNDNTGTSAADATTYANNGTLATGVTWLADPFSYSNGMPQALYHMDDGSGNATDSSGNNNTFTLSDDVSWSSTDLTGFSTGQSLNFNFPNTYGSAVDSNSLDITGKISLEAWIKPAENTGNRVLLVKGDDTQSRWNYKLYQSNDGITFSIYSSGAERSNVTPAFIVSGNTYHIVATFDENTDVVKIYVNNVEKYSGIQAYNMAANNDPLRLCKDVSGGSASYRGLIDEVRIYKRILTAEEIKRHYEHRLFALADPSIYNVYAPLVVPEMGAYADNNPVIQPVMGVFYTNKNLMQFAELSDKPVNTEIKYQISRDGYWWYWFSGASWVGVDAGYSQANSASVVNANLGAFQNMTGFEEGDFYYRAYIHSEPSSYKTPSLDNIAITLYNTETFYLDPAGATAINSVHTDADLDQWYQYKTILYSDGEATPILDDLNFEYIKSYINVLTPNGGEALSVGASYNVTWNSQAITKTTGLVKIEYSINGEPYTLVAGNLANTGSYAWIIPDFPSENVMLKISSQDYPVVSDTSNASFNILSLVVNSPNGGEIWEQAKTHNITWTSTGAVPFNVLKIDYSQNNGSTWATVNATVPDNGSYSWVIPLVASDQALVKVFSIYNTAIRDTSNAVFSIVPQPAIAITSPAGGETWVIGEKRNITWATNTRQFADQVILEYSNDDFNSDIRNIAQVSVGTPAGPNNNDDINGTYEWTIPDAVAAALKVRVREASVPAGRDTQIAISKASASFTIIEPSITVTAPTTGNVFVAGDIHNITWTIVGAISNDLLLEYSLDGSTYTQIATGEANDGTYSWTIPLTAFADNVYVRITDNQRTQIVGVSQAFKVLEYPLVTLTQPNGGEQLTIGTNYQIKWQTFGQKLDPGGSDYNKVSIYYSTDNGTNWTVIAYQSANTLIYSWLVPDEESNQCLVKIVDEADTRVTVTSAAVFTIVLPVITVTSPNGGELWYATGKYNINWTFAGSVSNNLKIEYSTDNGGSWLTVATGVTNSGSYEWASVADVNTSQALIRITDSNRPAVFDTSNAAFTISPPTITVTFPNGNEEFAVGTMQEITWTSNGKDYGAIRNQLTLQYSTDGGTSWTTIDINQIDDGSYMWIVPDSLSVNCKIKIFDASRTATVDTSDAAFKIVLPYVRVTAPNGNEQWPIGTKKNITWTAVGTISDNLTLQYSKDNFVTPIAIAAGVDNTGSYEWTIPNDYSTSAKVKIIDGDRPAIFDVSDAAFLIANPIIKVTVPNSAELWTAGDIENITWENTGSVGASLKIEYSKDNFLTDVILIEAAAPNSGATGTYAWTIPTDISATVRVRITDTARPATWDKSDMSFTILPRPVITITSPNGAEEWRVGTQKNITWTDNGGRISNNLTIQYCTDGGTVWKPVATGVSNTGSYAWTVPDDLSVICMVKIFDANRIATIDTSDDVFKILNPLITLTSPNGGEFWAVGDSAPITWTSEGTISNNLILEWSPNGGGDYYLILTGVTNDGSYTWTVPTDFPSTSNALFRITDGDRPAITDTSNQVFTIIPLPTITITQPTGGQEFVLGDATQITWTYKGLSITNNLLIEISNDNFVSRQIIDQGIQNNGNYTWILTGSTLTGATLKIRITDGSRTEIKAMSSGYFRIRGGFTIVAPNGNENWVAKSSQTISWQTRGNVQRVKLEYTTNDTTWNVIMASTANEGSYAWTLPDIKSSSVKIRVADPDDPTTFDVSDTAFNIVYATVTFKVLDYDTLQHLQDINFNEPASGWSDTGLTSPVTRTELYPYGTYTTFVTKTNYIDNSVTWNPPKSGITPYVITCYLENSASAQVTWEAILSYSFSPANDSLSAVGSLQRKGKLIGTNEIERADMGAATLTIYQPDGEIVKNTLSAVVPNVSGMYTFTYANTGFETGKVYPGVLSITYRDRPYLTSANIDVGSEILQYEFFTKTAANLATSVSKIELAVAGGTAQTRADIEASRVKLVSDIAATEAAVKSHVSSVLATAETNLTAKVEVARALIETGMKSQILNTENLVKTGETLTVRYRTHSGLSPVIDVYNADNEIEESKKVMKEIGTTGIYEYDVTFYQAYGKGDFTIVCSESTKGVLDALTITVIKTNIEQVYNQVSAVLGATAGISGLKQVADAMNSQFSIIETALSKVGKDLLKDVKDAASSAVALESVYNQVASVAKSVKQMTGDAGMNLEKLYKVSSDKKNDIVYLKNKTQELKAAVELTKQMTDNIANKPITQTWYEYKK